MDILIGKHGNQPFELSESSISREHAILHVDPTGRITLRDNNSTNGTWVLTKDGSFKRVIGEIVVSPETFIRLGASFTCTVKKILDKPEEPPVDITNLRTLYETYSSNKMALEAKQSNVMMWRMMSMSFGTVIGLIIMALIPSDITDNESMTLLIKAVSTIIPIVVSYFIVSIMNKNLIRKRDANERFFKQNYCCPKCHYHFGTTVYHNILALGKCPNNNCKCKFTGY